MLYADAARRLADYARRLVPTGRDQQIGDSVREALHAQQVVDRLVALAVAVERANGATWTQIAEAADVDPATAQERWGRPAAGILAGAARGLGPARLRAAGAESSAALAEDLDDWVLEHRQGDDPASLDPERPVSGRLTGGTTPTIGPATPAALRALAAAAEDLADRVQATQAALNAANDDATRRVGWGRLEEAAGAARRAAVTLLATASELAAIRVGRRPRR
ncbi:hypothetical protein GCM10020369_05220 [Cryptosporangium minutisporangium]|uniref:Uncharacterized protein n=1 Tax=Cryptosporangium minutisporangium TaxID=113569 RepID=A0ABP6SQ39_9ACTN